LVFWCQRDALFEICKSQLNNWEPVWRVLQGEPERIRRADELFAELYASIEAGMEKCHVNLGRSATALWRVLQTLPEQSAQEPWKTGIPHLKRIVAVAGQG
jgi:hypothetical protein